MLYRQKWLVLTGVLGLLAAGCSEPDSRPVYQTVSTPQAEKPPEEQTRETVLNEPSIEPPELTALFARLKKDRFSVSQSPQAERMGFYNCDTQENLLFSGEGVRRYVARRTVPEKGKYYPDFVLIALHFDSPAAARQATEQIRAATRTNTSDTPPCFYDKAPWEIVVSGAGVYYLSTRAEMFRGYIMRYGEVLEKAGKPEKTAAATP